MTFGARPKYRDVIPRGYGAVQKQIGAVQQDKLSAFCKISLPTAQVRLRSVLSALNSGSCGGVKDTKECVD